MRALWTDDNHDTGAASEVPADHWYFSLRAKANRFEYIFPRTNATLCGGKIVGNTDEGMSYVPSGCTLGKTLALLLTK